MWDVLSGVANTAWDVMSGMTKTARDVMSGVTKTAWDVLSGVANLCGMFCPGCQKRAWDVMSRDVLSGSLFLALWFQRRFLKIFYYDLMRANDPPHLANLGPWGMVGRVYIGNH